MSKGKQQSTQTTTVPQYQEDFYKKVYNRTEQESRKPFEAYTGTLIADQSQATKDALANAQAQGQRFANFDAGAGLKDLIGQRFSIDKANYNPNINERTDFSGATTDRTALGNVDKNMILGQLGNYLNPYTDINIDAGIRDLNKARMQQIMSDQDRAIGQNAYSGSRSALLEAETNKNYNEAVADFVDKKREDAFNVASNLASQDIKNALTADQFNIGLDRDIALANLDNLQQAGLLDQNLLSTENLALSDLDYRKAMMDQDVNMANANLTGEQLERDANIWRAILGAQGDITNTLNNMGLFQNQYLQSIADADRREWDRAQNWGARNLGILQSGVSGISPLISTSGETKKKVGLLDAVGPALQMASLFSDSRLKKSIKFLFKLANGINIYSWKWNEKAKDLDIPEDYTVGVLAQEVMHIPNAVIMDESGFYKVNYEALQ